MNLINIFIFYYIISGICAAIGFYYLSTFDASKVEIEDAIADVTWATGISRKKVKALMYALCLLGGFLILPTEIVEALWRALTGKEE
jgi:hypothetical protein